MHMSGKWTRSVILFLVHRCRLKATLPPRTNFRGVWDRFRLCTLSIALPSTHVAKVKDDGCGQCPQHEPFAAMRDALNNTGRPIFYAIHSSIIGTGNPNATVANMWRTGGDLSSATYDMWTNRCGAFNWVPQLEIRRSHWLWWGVGLLSVSYAANVWSAGLTWPPPMPKLP